MSTISVRDLKQDPHNPRRRTQRGTATLDHSLRRYGAARSIVIDKDGVVRAGNGTLQAAIEAGIEKVVVVDGDPDTLIAVRRSDWSETEAEGYSVMDNQSAALAEWDYPVLEDKFSRLSLPGEDFGFVPEEMRAIDANVSWSGQEDVARTGLSSKKEAILDPCRFQVTVLVSDDEERIRGLLEAALEGSEEVAILERL